MICTALLGLALLAQGAQPEPVHPNIVLVLADDLGFGDPRCYNPGSRVDTPAMDRLAAEGMRLFDMHTPSAVCSPTRYGLLTGRYAWRTSLKSGVLWGRSPALIERFRGTSGAGPYGDFVAQVDDTLGRLLATLDELELAKNTLVIFTSDNGAHWTTDDIDQYAHRANGSWRGQKADIHEGGHRVPFLARGVSRERALQAPAIAIALHALCSPLGPSCGPIRLLE